MPKRMDNLTMREVSAVDRAANGIEGWMVMKSFTPDQAALLTQALAVSKGADPEPGSHGGTMPIDFEKAERAELKAYVEGLEKALLTGRPAPTAPAAPTEADSIAKAISELPHGIREVVAKAQRDAAEAQDEVRKERERREHDELTQLTKSWSHLPEVTDATADILFKARNGDRKALDDVFTLLTKAEAVVKGSAAFQEFGTSRVTEDSPEGRFMALVKAEQEADTKLDYVEAVTKASAKDPAAYREYRAANLNTGGVK